MLDVCDCGHFNTYESHNSGAGASYLLGRRAARSGKVMWTSVSQFLDMGGYGFYVWGSYLVTLICIAGELVLVFNRKRTLLKHLSLIHQSNKQEKRNETAS
ncbi:heme exporter protein CcmD [Nitrosospira sp. Is2]|nr:heme exporter protein CcmD [Nitrosospira sp. Is2]WON73406.1 heme exporter protein CcmD [Nitrosospira sp. Is2]